MGPAPKSTAKATTPIKAPEPAPAPSVPPPAAPPLRPPSDLELSALKWGPIGAFGQVAAMAALIVFAVMKPQTMLSTNADGRLVRPPSSDLSTVLMIEGVVMLGTAAFVAAIAAIRTRHPPSFGTGITYAVGVLAILTALAASTVRIVGFRYLAGNKDLSVDAYGAVAAIHDSLWSLSALLLGGWVLMVSVGAIRRRHLPFWLAWLGVPVGLCGPALFLLGSPLLLAYLGATAAWFLGLSSALGRRPRPLKATTPASTATATA